MVGVAPELRKSSVLPEATQAVRKTGDVDTSCLIPNLCP